MTLSNARRTGQVVAAPWLWLRLEGGVAAAASAYLYARAPGSWGVFTALFLAPDLSLAAYLVNPRLGAMAYNVVHTYVGPATLAGVAIAAGWSPLPALIWTAHIGLDRLLGYGLKYRNAFHDTHLGRLGESIGTLRDLSRGWGTADLDDDSAPIKRTCARLAVSCAMVLGILNLTTHAHAQTVSSFEALPGVLTVGQLVSVTDHRGRSTKGRLLDLSPSALAVVERDSLGSPRRTTILAADVVQIRRWDRLWNGLFIGAGVGAGVTAGVVHQRCGPRNSECTANVGGVLAFALVPAFAGVGALVDRWLGNGVVFSAASPASFAAPVQPHRGTLGAVSSPRIP